MGTGKRIQLFE